MKIERRGGTLNISGIKELLTANSDSFRQAVCAALPENLDDIVIDLSETESMDCGGLGALISVRKTARRVSDHGAVRLVNPTPPVRQIFQLTRMDGAFHFENWN